ncbi:hypothetical protein JCM8547_002448 [Rhodosporidiobolus lusitaniae]
MRRRRCSCHASGPATACRTKLLYNGQCVDTCPSGTLAQDGKCEQCSTLYSGSAVCDERGALSWHDLHVDLSWMARTRRLPTTPARPVLPGTLSPAMPPPRQRSVGRERTFLAADACRSAPETHLPVDGVCKLCSTVYSAEPYVYT